MALGLAALLDDVALLARSAAASVDDVATAAVKTSSKAISVVVDDTAVTPQYVRGVEPARELPIIWGIAWRSLINKAIIIVLGLTLTALAPWALTPILMLGGAYLTFEAMEKVVGKLTGHDDHAEAVIKAGPEAEKKLIRTAATTDFILSAEIMFISLAEVTELPPWERALILVAVALLITTLVYGVVAILVKADDVGAKMATANSSAVAATGRRILHAMPRVLTVIAVIGTFAMLWVGGHLVIQGFAELGWHGPLDFEHHLVDLAENPALRWIIETVCSMIYGAIIGLIVVAVVLPISLLVKRATTASATR
ncbi:MAG: DUF808 domain-containing protein [Corynebacterium sp.]|nr:DUF808 domain-containing protein [Corynebacterium sp.]